VLTHRRCPGRAALDDSLSPVAALTSAFEALPVDALRTYADILLTRLVVAKAVLERRAPAMSREWWAAIERQALDALNDAADEDAS